MIFWQIFWTFFKIGAFSFGGGYGMIPLITQELVEQHGWVTMEQLVDMVAISQMTPGPIAINIATFAGYQTAGFAGSLVATIGIIAPSAMIVIIGVSYFLKHHEHPKVQAVLKGIRPVVIALIAYSGLMIAQGVIDGWVPAMMILMALVASHYYKLHPMIVLGAGGGIGILFYLFL